MALNKGILSIKSYPQPCLVLILQNFNICYYLTMKKEIKKKSGFFVKIPPETHRQMKRYLTVKNCPVKTLGELVKLGWERLSE